MTRTENEDLMEMELVLLKENLDKIREMYIAYGGETGCPLIIIDMEDWDNVKQSKLPIVDNCVVFE